MKSNMELWRREFTLLELHEFEERVPMGLPERKEVHNKKIRLRLN